MSYLIYRCLRLLHRSRRWLFQELTPTGLGVLACLVIAAIAGGGSTQSLCHLLFLFALVLLVFAGIGSRLVHYRFRATRILPRFGTVGEPLRYQVIIQNLTPTDQRGLKFVETVIERFPSFGDFRAIQARYCIGLQWIKQWRQWVARQAWAIAPSQDLPPLSADTKTKVMGEILPLRRGRLTLESMTLACPDPLGLIYKRQTYALPQSICILPKRFLLPPLNLSNARCHQRGESALVSSIGEALEFRSLRDYRPGDPTNKIHWKSWAKVGRPIVKEQQEDSAIHHALILDTFHTDPYNESFEAALRVAISFLTQAQPEENKLDVIFAAPEPRCVTVGRGLNQRAQLLEAIATLDPCPHQDMECLTPILESRLNRLSGCLCLFIQLDETRYAFLKHIAQYGIPIKAIFLCEQTIDPTADLGYSLAPHCHIHLVSINNLEQDLRLL